MMNTLIAATTAFFGWQRDCSDVTVVTKDEAQKPELAVQIADCN
jgi:hypothetical protein